MSGAMAITLVSAALHASLFATVVALGLRTSLTGIANVLRKPAALVKALVAMNLLMPIYALLVGRFASLRPEIEIVLIALAVSPVPPLVPGRVARAGCESSYITALLAVAASVAIVVVPLSLRVESALLGLPVTVSAGRVAALVASTVLAPLAIGIAVRHVAPRFADRAAPTITRVAMGVLVVAAVPLLASVWPRIAALLGDGTAVALAGFVLVGTLGGFLLGGPDANERTALSIATASRHPAIALAIASASAVDTKIAAAAIILYLAIGLLISAPFALHRRRQRRAATTPVDRGASAPAGA